MKNETVSPNADHIDIAAEAIEKALLSRTDNDHSLSSIRLQNHLSNILMKLSDMAMTIDDLNYAQAMLEQAEAKERELMNKQYLLEDHKESVLPTQTDEYMQAVINDDTDLIAKLESESRQIINAQHSLSTRNDILKSSVASAKNKSISFHRVCTSIKLSMDKQKYAELFAKASDLITQLSPIWDEMNSLCIDMKMPNDHYPFLESSLNNNPYKYHTHQYLIETKSVFAAY